MRMVNPTLSTIQKRHPLVAQPLPPPPNTMMKRFMIHRQGGILTSLLTQICDVPNVSRYPLPSEGCSHRTSNQTTAAPGSRRGSVTRQPQGMTMQPPRALPRLQRNIDSPPRIAVGVVERGRAHGYLLDPLLRVLSLLLGLLHEGVAGLAHHLVLRGGLGNRQPDGRPDPDA